jgi:hypothetical protein
MVAREINASTTHLFTTAERGRDMQPPPVYAQSLTAQLQAVQHTRADLDEIEDWTDRAARRMYEGAGLGPEDVDVVNRYDGYVPMAQFRLEAFQWHGVKHGNAFALYAGDFRVEGPDPLCPTGGNLGNGRIRTAMYTDSAGSPPEQPSDALTAREHDVIAMISQGFANKRIGPWRFPSA